MFLIGKFRSLRIKFFIVIVIVLTSYLVIIYVFMERFLYKETPRNNSVVLPYVVVHIDLKGSPPKLKYLHSLLPQIKSHGANGLLMEYEDMFPFEGRIANLSAKNNYEKTELKKFLTDAHSRGFEIIPLVQTFGHMEYALKLEEFQHLREIPLFPDSICPNKADTRSFIKDILYQIINLHKSIAPLKYIHIGCDEVYHINKCEKCVSKNLPEIDIFLNHVKAVKDIVKSLSPRTTVLIWDDMLRGLKPAKWETINQLKNIEPVYWDYKPDLMVSHVNLLTYHKKFKNIWIASAFKGADGKTATVPNINNRLLNHFSWMNLILGYKFGGEKKVYNFKGIILTGWSRYSHMDPPCELMPASIPSLLLNLLLIKQFKDGITNDEVRDDLEDFFIEYIDAKLKRNLQCDRLTNIDNFDAATCIFDGDVLLDELKEYIELDRNIKSTFNNDESGLSAVEYYSKSNIINMYSVPQHIEWCNDSLRKLLLLENRMFGAMSRYYDIDFIEEYVKSKTYEGKKKLYEMLAILKNYLKIQSWLRRGDTQN